ncbi:ABC transporter permease [Paenisporosarcina sp. OV554]|uniref:ABC transporter permease n=1 Tax=Paenisporosarcina sp. OV554 TaxID=2135694 RepID=UPI000D3A71E2|nr:ABC transporter permease [Paenisporosarcina sp. OV554]PUB12511.1 osmoprotectant transport system permease protein [Paenisporosarcina sp. OV554]
MEFIQYIGENFTDLLSLAGTHILLVVAGICLALIIGFPLGIIAAKFEKVAPVILSLTNVLQLIPSIAMLAVLMLYFGLGNLTMTIGICLYSLMPIVRNTYVGIKEVKAGILEAGVGIGMTSMQVLTKVQIPLSIPFLMTGLRVAVVIAVSVACLGPYIGAGGLGVEIASGINTLDTMKIYSGVIPAALLAIIADFVLGKIEKKTKKRLA